LYLLTIKQVECDREIGINKASTSKKLTCSCCRTNFPQRSKFSADAGVRFQSEESRTMKNTIFTLIIMVVGFITSSCSDTENEKVQATPIKQVEAVAVTPEVMTEAVEIIAEVIVTEDKRIIIKGTTNLPNTTALVISLNSEISGLGAQDTIKVSNNRFSTSPLGKATGIPDGHYIIDITVPVSSVQSEAVQAIIGKEGEYLTGPLVEDDWGLRVAVKTTTYSLGSPESIAKNEKEHQDLVVSIRQGLAKLLVQGQEMEFIRHDDGDLNKSRSCGIQMRKNQSIAEQLSQRSKVLSLKYIVLKAATTGIQSCVSCKSSALEACGRVKKSLQESEI
jgi:hypothetical protein